MKDKEKWALEYVEQFVKDQALMGSKVSEVEYAMMNTGWLEGFEFAKKKCSDAVCECCSNPRSCLEVGEDDSDIKPKDIEPVPPTSVGENFLVNGVEYGVVFYPLARRATVVLANESPFESRFIGAFECENYNEAKPKALKFIEELRRS